MVGPIAVFAIKSVGYFLIYETSVQAIRGLIGLGSLASGEGFEAPTTREVKRVPGVVARKLFLTPIKRFITEEDDKDILTGTPLKRTAILVTAVTFTAIGVRNPAIAARLTKLGPIGKTASRRVWIVVNQTLKPAGAAAVAALAFAGVKRFD